VSDTATLPLRLRLGWAGTSREGRDIAPPGPAALAPGWSTPLARLVPYVFAVTTGLQLAGVLAYQPMQVGFDARLYSAAAQAWLTGGNPWLVSDLGVHFAAPPPSLLLFAPFAFLPEVLVTWIWVLGSIAVAVAALRALGAPMWWLLWWPIASGCLVGSADIVVLGLLVIGRRAGWLAPLAKVYAFLPLLAERRWTSVLVAAAALLATAPILPWGMFFAGLPAISEHLARVAATTSVFGMPILFVIGVVALLALGLRRAGWLAVPVLWPSTQPHYLVSSIPAMSPTLALAWSFPHPLVVVSGVVLEVVLHSPFRRSQEGKVRS
jgi:hypothetical protein